jgi:hypothetical protein
MYVSVRRVIKIKKSRSGGLTFDDKSNGGLSPDVAKTENNKNKCNSYLSFQECEFNSAFVICRALKYQLYLASGKRLQSN